MFKIGSARESVAVLMNDEWHSAVIGLGCVSPRILQVKFKFSRVKALWQNISTLNGKIEEKEK